MIRTEKRLQWRHKRRLLDRLPDLFVLLLFGTGFAWLTAVATGCRSSSDDRQTSSLKDEEGRDSPKGPYGRSIEPIFRSNCIRCHNAIDHKGGLRMDTYGALMRGGKDGAVIRPGDPGHSLLVTLIRHAGAADNPMPMPPKSKLSDQEISTITQWIQDGAPR